MNESAAYSNEALGALVAWETETGVLSPQSLILAAVGLSLV